MTFWVRLITGCALFGLVLAPAHAAITVQPGEWQDTETGTEDGKPVKPEVTSSCITAEEAKDPAKQLSAMMKDPGAGQCQQLDVKESGNTIALVMKCGDPKQMSFDITGTFTFLTPTHYTGTMKSTVIFGGKTMTQDKKIDSVRIGECKSGGKK